MHWSILRIHIVSGMIKVNVFGVKWRIKTMQGIKCLTDAQASKIAGEDLDYHRRDLYNAIEQGEFPKWQIQVQIMPENNTETYHIHPFDLTKVWPHKDYPLIDVGIIELNCNPQNYFAEVEQAAFEPSNMPQGLGASPDKMLQARLLSYADTHRYRIGINYSQLPVNKPRCPVHTYNRDGHMSYYNYDGEVNYQPNSFNGPVDDKQYSEPHLKISGDADCYDHHIGNDDYTQAGDLYPLMNADQKNQLINNIVHAMSAVPKEIQVRQISQFYKADPDYGGRVAKRS